MDDYSLKSSELEAATNALERILGQSVEEIELSDTVPVLDEVSDSNKVFKGKLSVLFIDIRGSVDLTDDLKSKRMVKVYRGFIRMAIQAIRYSGGLTRQFAGDCVMGVFQDSAEDDCTISSSAKAVTAARYIHTLIDYCLNPALKNHMGDVCIGCGVGIATGSILITKVGMRGKEADEASENETGIVWVGSTTNYANRYCSLANAGEIFIDEKTYREIGNPTGWEKASRVKGNKAFRGYTVREFYLPLPSDFAQEAIKAENDHNQEKSFVQEIFDETQEHALMLVDEISKKSAELSVALNNVRIREQRVTARENDASKEDLRLKLLQQKLNSKQAEIEKNDKSTKADAYKIYRSIFSNTYCKKQVIKQYNKDYWLQLIEKMYDLGESIGKSRLQVNIDLDCYLIGIYRCFGLYNEAYEALCVQAEHSSWLNTYVLEDVVRESGHWVKLKRILEERCTEKKDFRDGLQQLKNMGY